MISHESLSRAEFLRRATSLFAVAAIGPRVAGWRAGATPFPHPDPRPGITAEHVLSVETLGASRSKRVLDAYDAARTYPEIFDGLYCACQCGGKSGHRSLLACYETMQPSGCGGCQEEGELAGRLAKQEKTLAEIRLAVDKAYG
jgi:hypothetical protein